MKTLPYEVVCNGITVAYVENLQLAKVLTYALIDNVNNIQDLHISHIATEAEAPAPVPVPTHE